MKIIRDLHAPKNCKGTVLALGNFDGVHLGHQAIFNHCIALAKAENCPAAVMTFEPHPREFFANLNLRSSSAQNAIFGGTSGAAQAAPLNTASRSEAPPNQTPMRIYPLRCKASLIAECGIDITFIARFGKRLASTSAESFIKDILHKDLAVRHVVTGYNFAFGKGRQGNTEMLAHMAQSLGFGFTAHQPVFDENGATISSSRIRELLKAGKMGEVARDLGRPYRIVGHVQRGKQRGRELGFPTANIALGHLMKPRLGIYAARMKIENETKWRDAVASVGVNPTFSPVEPLLEVHGFDVKNELYGKRLSVELLEFIRDEKKFDNSDLLTRQMKLDCDDAKKILSSSPIHSGI